MKTKIKIIIDILMFLCIIALMGYHITQSLIHEILGTFIFVLFVIHNILNIKWYLTIFKGKHDSKRNFHILINLALLIAFIATIVSGIMMSKELYTFVKIGSVSLARKIHLIANSWTLVLVSIHMGMHLFPLTTKVTNNIKENKIKRLVRMLFIAFIIIGCCNFISIELYKDMFGITAFKYFNFNENPILFYFKYINISLSIALITDLIKRNIRE